MKHSIMAQQFNVNEMVQFVVSEGTVRGNGRKIVMRFPNNYGVSIVKHSALLPNNYGAGIVKHYFSYGAFAEVAVIKFDKKSNKKFTLVYDTPVADDVIGCDTPNEVRAIIQQVMLLGG